MSVISNEDGGRDEFFDLMDDLPLSILRDIISRNEFDSYENVIHHEEVGESLDEIATSVIHNVNDITEVDDEDSDDYDADATPINLPPTLKEALNSTDVLINYAASNNLSSMLNSMLGIKSQIHSSNAFKQTHITDFFHN